MQTLSIVDYLSHHNIKSSQQRIAVMRYLMDHRTHPSVEDIYAALHDEYPTLSKTTIYNTLRVLVENGAAQMLTIDERHVCYDADIEDHAHMLCKQCGKVIDIPIHSKNIIKATQFPQGVTVDRMNLYYRGICPMCASTQNNK